MDTEELKRAQAKTAAQRLVNVLVQEFNYAPKIAHAILAEAQACLLGAATTLQVGQVRKLLVAREAPHGAAVSASCLVEVVWTLDAGTEDAEVLQRAGAVAVRRVRLQRLVDEALSQGAVASQEDLAQGLQVSVRTIKRDCAYLQAQGLLVATRGALHGIGRGQTHKAQIVGQWLHGATYDQITRRTHHSEMCVQRYIQAFARVVQLQQQGLSPTEIGVALGMSAHLVAEYLSVYQQHDTPFCRERLQEQLTRLTQAPGPQKNGGSDGG